MKLTVHLQIDREPAAVERRLRRALPDAFDVRRGEAAPGSSTYPLFVVRERVLDGGAALELAQAVYRCTIDGAPGIVQRFAVHVDDEEVPA